MVVVVVLLHAAVCVALEGHLWEQAGPGKPHDSAQRTANEVSFSAPTTVLLRCLLWSFALCFLMLAGPRSDSC